MKTLKGNKEKFIVVGLMLSLILVTGVISYAAFRYSLTGSAVNTITTGVISMSYTESSNVISMTGALPTTDATGKTRLTEGEYFDFTVSSTIQGSININYEIAAEELTGNTIDGKYIKYYLTKINNDGTETEVMFPKTYNATSVSNDYTGRPSNMMSLLTGSMNASEVTKYRLRLYVDEAYNPQGDGGSLVYKTRINVYGKDGSVLVKANAPLMDDNMIAVKYDGTKWVKTDSSNNWYNYEDGVWANAVTVKSDKLSTYRSLAVDKEIAMEDIETMWVWIPRYSYTIGSEDGTNYYGKQGEYLDATPTKALPGEIDVKFISVSEKDRGTAKYIVSEGVSGWYTPDAFTFDGKELAGIWVGKFETSSSDPNAENGGGNDTNLDPMIKPNVVSWRKINMKNIHTVSTKVTASGNRYGFSSMESHAMKNDEWAAVAYLSQSRFGKLGNESYKGAYKEVFINNNSNFVTGCSAGSPNGPQSINCDYTYDISTVEVAGEGGKGTGASITGNIYGVYDMNGGAWEYVMANYNDTIGPSGFSTMPEVRYYNRYTTTDIKTACNGVECLSHALSETGSWYNGYSNFVYEQNPWLFRGGYYDNSTRAGVFCFVYTGGVVHGLSSFRLVMSK